MSATRWIAAACAVALSALCAQAPTPRVVVAAEPPATTLSAPLNDAGYLEVADRLSARLAPLWSERLQRYEAGSGTTTEVNADLLLVHSVAALAGHRGPARDDARACAAARFLTSPRIYHGGAHPAWWAGPANPNTHVVFEAETAEGLAMAYTARAAIGLDEATVDRIRRQIGAVAHSPDWRWPALVMNQLNWYATMFAADATVNGHDAALANGLRRHLQRFAANAAPHGAAPGNLGPGLRFNYQPARWPYARMNFDSAEYANIVLGFSRVYEQARAAGMPRPRSLPLLHEWVQRVVSGYWTHAGYLNWDTGLSFTRWHARKKAALAEGALVGVAAADELQPSPRWGRWAKWMLDRGLLGYVAETERAGQIPSALAYGVHVLPQDRGNAYLAAARYAVNAMRALRAGLGTHAASEPPALYAFDPDTGRLAITTPAYNTAIVAVNHDAFPYGGVDLARLFDGDQQVAANIGGTGAAAFGLRLGATRTQYGARSAGASPLRLVSAPLGVGASVTARHAFAGPFTDLRVRGTVGRLTSEYRFTARAIEARWTVRGAGGRPFVTFPSWGRGAHVDARLRDGRTVALSDRPLALAEIRSLCVCSEHSGYTIVPLAGSGTVRIVRVRPQGSQPNPGPTVEVALAGRSLAVRLLMEAAGGAA